MSKHAPPYPNAATDPFNQVPGMNRPPMTAETDLLPLPEPDNDVAVDGEGNETLFEFFNAEQIRDYARANVAHATAPLQAEVEALRAEVERANSWNERVSVCRDHVADIVDGPCVICALDAAEARAERLAEALAGLIAWIPSADTYRRLGFDPEAPMRALEEARAALAKENRND